MTVTNTTKLSQLSASGGGYAISIIENMPKNHLSLNCSIGGELLSVQYLIDDYVIHLEHHLKQITSY